jgi:hypothetical protein
MSREIKRVALDFDWPITGHNTWKGYIRQCDNDDGDGYCEGCDDCASIDPPAGEGWQLWETTSEGSPMSPVFATADELAQWMGTNPCLFAGGRTSYETALKWITDGGGWSPSMVATSAGLVDGVTWVANTARAESS